jgi:hypothetical protein
MVQAAMAKLSDSFSGLDLTCGLTLVSSSHCSKAHPRHECPRMQYLTIPKAAASLQGKRSVS